MSKQEQAASAGGGKSAHDQHKHDEATRTVIPRNPAFTQRFGPVGVALADALKQFSLDVVGIVAAYLVCGVATAGAKSQELFSFTDKEQHPTVSVWALAASPDASQIWVACHSKISVFDADSQRLFSVPIEGFVCGIAFSSHGRAFISSFWGHRVVECKSDGSVVRTFGTRGSGEGQLSHPMGVAVKGDLLFVVDNSNSRVVVYNTNNCQFVRSFGSCGDGDGQFRYPRALAVSAAGDVYVSDEVANRIQVRHWQHCCNHASHAGVRREGFLSSQVRSGDGSGPGQLNNPAALAFDRADNVLVCDINNFRVQVLTAHGTFVTAFETDPSSKPYSVHVDRDGRILVGDQLGRVHVLAFPS